MNNMYFIAKWRYKDEWLEGNLVTIDMPFSDKDPPYILDFNGIWPVHKQSIGAVTGLEDLNEKRILGSIPVDGKMSKGGSIVISPGNTIFKIVYYDRWAGFWIIPVKNKGARTSLTIYDSEIVQVIGNQFDNPELLEK